MAARNPPPEVPKVIEQAYIITNISTINKDLHFLCNLPATISVMFKIVFLSTTVWINLKNFVGFFVANFAFCLIYGSFFRDLIKGYLQVVSRLHSVSAWHTCTWDSGLHSSVQHFPATELKRETKVTSVSIKQLDYELEISMRNS